MAISSVDVTNSWSAITTAGKSGICFVRDIPSLAGINSVFVTHSTSGSPAADTIAYIPLYPCRANNDYMILSADNANDIFYARCANTSGVAKIIVDVV